MTASRTSSAEAAPDPKEGFVASRPIFEGRVVNLSVDTVRFPDGSTGDLEMIRHSGAAAVLPVFGAAHEIDPEILLIRQYRYASDGYMYEVPAGRPSRPGEPWEICARRELEEETGLVAGSLEYLTAIHTTPGFTDELIHLYLARELTPGSQARDPDEFIELKQLRLSAALDLIRHGDITDGKTICTLLFASRFHIPPAPRDSPK
jgi:ADP-ribose pyrophosphatase